MTIWAFRQRGALLRMWQPRWDAMVKQLGHRGGGNRESGAFLLADRIGDPHTVTRVVLLDDLDPKCLQGGIHMEGLAYSKLWDILAAEHRVVIGDVHTHPGRFVCQSDIDADNPMVAQPGHVALILPDLAMHPVKPREVGVHRYDGNEWTTWTGAAAAQQLLVSWLI